MTKEEQVLETIRKGPGLSPNEYQKLALTAYGIGYDLEDILRMNIEKLRARYPNGFDAEHSLHRKPGDT